MTRLDAGGAVDAAALEVEFEPLPADQVRAGAPATRYIEVDVADERTVGVWEHTPGASTDVEADEVFVVLAGAGILRFEEPSLPDVTLRPGVIVRLTEGMRTEWTITETLRKVYVAP